MHSSSKRLTLYSIEYLTVSSSKGLTLYSIEYLTGYSSIVVVPREILLLDSDPPQIQRTGWNPVSFWGWLKRKWVNPVPHLVDFPLAFMLMAWTRCLELPGLWEFDKFLSNTFALGEGVVPSLAGLGSSEKYFHSVNVQKYDIYVSAETSGYAWWLWWALLKSWQHQP